MYKTGLNCFFSYIYIYETGFLCVIALAVLELALVDQAGLELKKIRLTPPGLKFHIDKRKIF